MSTQPPTAENVTAAETAGSAAPGHVQRLLGRVNFERVSSEKYRVEDFELSRMAALLSLLGEPQLATPCVHVAGSKGKGSVASAVSAALTAGGLRTGLFTSPHVHTFEERIRIGDRFMPAGVWDAAFTEVWDAVDRLDGTGRAATFFEITTAVAWCAFRREQCDVAVMEVGLGGRLDSTNLCRPAVTVITSISRDHGHLLGHTLDKIAAEKAGILKPGVPAVSGAGGVAAEVITRTAASVGASLWTLGTEVQLTPSGGDRMAPRTARVQTPGGERELPVVLPGEHQERNVAIAAAALERLPDALRPSAEAVRQGFASLRCPLRVEVVSRRPRVVLDAAHNGASVAALREAVGGSVRGGRRWLIFGTSRDKHVGDMLEQLRGFADRVIVTAYSTNPRALSAEDLAADAERVLRQTVEIAPDPMAAVRMVRKDVSEADEVVVTGSFFLAGEVREHLTAEPLVAKAAFEDTTPAAEKRS